MTLEDLRIALIELDEKRTVRSAQELLAGGEAPPQSILSTCQNALRVVGERYERQEYYLSALIMAGEIFTRVLKLVEPDTEPVPPTTTMASGVRDSRAEAVLPGMASCFTRSTGAPPAPARAPAARASG